PPDLVARHPPAQRSAARMLVLRRDAETIEHRAFIEFPQFVRPNDIVVLNDTRVVPARVFGEEGTIELLFLGELEPNIWKCLVKPGRKMRKGVRIRVGGRSGEVRALCEDGERIIA